MTVNTSQKQLMTMILKHKYVVGCHVMFYEIEMLWEYVDSIIEAVRKVDNPQNVAVQFCWNTQQYLETIDEEKLSADMLLSKFAIQMSRLRAAGCSVFVTYKTDDNPFYNIAQYRRDLNHEWCDMVDFVLWGETDSLFPVETFDIIESVSEYASKHDIHRYVISFADRKNWDASWDIITHPKYEDVQYVDDKDWLINNEASSKSYMTRERMNEINSESDSYDIRRLPYPKFDGACLVISSDLIRMGVNIPHALLHCGEDTSFGEMAYKLMGDRFTQFVIKNILRVHNRRHPRKRNYIKGEDNPMGFVGMEKGPWWDILEQSSKHNLSLLGARQDRFITMDELMRKIREVRR